MQPSKASVSDGVSRRSVLKRGLLASSALAAGIATVPGGAYAGPSGRAPPDAKGCDVVVPDDEATIQGGVDAADPGGEVCVRAAGGPYVEQVVIPKDLTLRGVDEPRIGAPSDPREFTIPESDASWEPVVFAFGGSESGGAVTGTEVASVDVTGFTVDGDDRQPGDRSVGVMLRNVSGDVTDNVVENMGVGGKQTFGVFAYGDSDLRVHGNDVSGYERGGIGANGDGGDHPAPSVDVRGNAVSGSTGTEVSWAPNGIQIGFGAEGTVLDNDVSDNRWAADLNASFVASGILLFDSGGVTVRGNRVRNSDAALVTATAGNNRFVANEVEDALVGVFLSGVDNNKVVNNDVTDAETGGDDPLDIGVFNSGENNKVIRNRIEGFDVPIADAGTDAKVHANEP